jgi:putative NADPH-quinone reductase
MPAGDGRNGAKGRTLAASTYEWSTPLRVFILYANPVAWSFGATLRKQVVTTLRSRGHEIDDCDLYAESFNPVMAEQERMRYHNANLNRAPIAAYADRLLAAEALVLIYPVWNEGFPAILKGFFDRVFIPGVSFKIGPDGAAIPNLQKLRKLAAVCTYGASRTTSFLLGDPPKRVVKRLVRSMPGHAVRCDYLATTIWIIPTPSSGPPSWRRSNEHSRLGETARRAHRAQAPRLRPQGCEARRISDRRYKASG